MGVISLSAVDLALAALLVLALAAACHLMRLGIGSLLVVAALRTTVQLLLVGFVLKGLFAHAHLGWITLVAIVMLAVAGREVMARQRHAFIGPWGYGLGASAMFVSGFSVTVFALVVVIGPEPWYMPQYAIPLLGMILGNAMTSVALTLERLTESALAKRAVIEARLAVGDDWKTAIGEIRRDSIRVGLLPTINAMAAAGLVSLPGMMTGQILAGSAPLDAVKYQILIMFLISVATGIGAVIAVAIGSRRLFDERERLRLERLRR